MIELPDQSQQEEPDYGYKRKYDPDEIEVIAECHTCGVLLTTFEEVLTYNERTFCGRECIADYDRLITDEEI